MSEFNDKLAASVDEALDIFEYGPLGFREYQDVTGQLQSLQDNLIDYLATFNHLGEYDEAEETVMVYALSRNVENSFDCLDDIQVGDEVLMSGLGAAIAVETSGYYSLVTIDSDIRLHGKIKRASVMEVPVLESINKVENEPTLSQMSAVIEVDTATLESRQPDEARFFDLPDESRIFIPVVYSELKLKRRVDAALQEG